MFRKVYASFAVAMVGAAVFATSAFAVTVPDVPVGPYANSLLSAVATVITDILPYAAAITAFAIGVGMLRRWLGHRKASQI